MSGLKPGVVSFTIPGRCWLWRHEQSTSKWISGPRYASKLLSRRVGDVVYSPGIPGLYEVHEPCQGLLLLVGCKGDKHLSAISVRL